MAFSAKKNRLIPDWIFSQSGNLWRFIFAGDSIIFGETRDLNKRIVYFFSIDIIRGKTLLKDFLFEKGNYWLSIEGATSETVFLHRYVKPELPYHNNIIALNIRTGKKLWENDKYIYLFNTNEELYAYKQNFESQQIVELDINGGGIIKIFPEEEHNKIFELRDSNADYTLEFSDYPLKYEGGEYETISSVIKKETAGIETKGNIEYIIRGNYFIFNYYAPAGIDMKDLSRKFFENRFRIYDIETGEKIYSDTLNKKSTYNVPDNFFMKNNNLFYLREKKEIVAMKLI